MTAPDRWREAAACAWPGVDPEAFYPLDLDPAGLAVTAARRICGACPVRGLCLADVMASEDPARRWGVIAGLTPEERTELHRDQLIPTRAAEVAA
ncbi:transcription factor WhiB [Pseudonocardia dioxanivorans CB1190]|uniref:Transcription factor WhiB n=1 Tax=Pseudonocardia dioxanivorans (strain ATCC 55486 / DSM 44775 / JCM 13855 / CB1190) TaxID=675635 RepID=F4CYT4_PSEUX|nr:WhiB family transcriptional regulator [Pseudonocardia dioxanivorans]AEA27659.1 transcription factor WhiB [Pseudonocardia dioxanivorans CB1190]